MQKFKAYRTFQENDAVVSRFVDMTVDELDPGDVVVRTKYSTINYKDALSYNGAGKIMRKYPTNAGIDMAGTVESSTDSRWKRGDKVIVHAYDLGVAHDGGYAEFVRVPADWVVRRPESMTAFDAMTLGTAGFTAAQAIMAKNRRRVVRAPRIMGEAYHIILEKLIARGFVPPRAPVKLPKAKLILIVLRNLV